jgi:hypothetical protein
MRDTRVTPSYTSEPLTRLLTRPLSQRTLNCPHQRGRSRGPLGTARGGQEQRLLAGRGGLHARAGEALGTFDVARSSERRDEQERCMHGDGAEGSRQGSRADAGADRRRAAPSGKLLPRTGSSGNLGRLGQAGWFLWP